MGGQIEVLNRSLQQYLRAIVMRSQKKWEKYLHWVEWQYKTAINSVIGYSTFQTVYGRPPPVITIYIHSSTRWESLESTLLPRDELLENLRSNLLKVMKTMKPRVDKHRSDISFQKGDWVLLKLQSYRQQSLAKREHHKPNRRYFGPYQICHALNRVN